MPAHSLMYCMGNRNKLSVLGALQKQDKLNPVFISSSMGNFGNIGRKDMAERLSYKIPIGVETSVLKDNQPIQQQITKTMHPTNTALKVGINRQIGDISDVLTGGRYVKAPLGDTNDRIQKGQGIFDKLSSAIGLIESGRALKEGISDIAEAGSELAFGPIGTYLSNVASEKFNKNPNWRSGFEGEKHALISSKWGLTRANWLGPGTQVLKRLERGDPSVDGPKGLDACAKVHDIAYGLARTEADVRKADNDFLKCLEQVETSFAMKNFVKGLFKTKKLAEDVGFLNPDKFAPDIRKEIEKSGTGLFSRFDLFGLMQKASHMGTGFKGHDPQGSVTAQNVMGGVGIHHEVKQISKFFKANKKSLSQPLNQLRHIAFSVPQVQEKVEEIIEEFLPGEQLKMKLVGMAKRKDVKTSSSMPTKKKGKGLQKKHAGRGFSAQNVMMSGAGVPHQSQFSGHILAGNVNTESAFSHAKGAGRQKGRGRKRQEGGQIIASIIAGVVVPELIKFVGNKIKQATKKKKKKKRK